MKMNSPKRCTSVGSGHRCRIAAVAMLLFAMAWCEGVLAQDGGKQTTVVVRVPAVEGRAEDVDVRLVARRPARDDQPAEEVNLRVLSIQPIVTITGGKGQRFRVTFVQPDHVTRDRYSIHAFVDAGNVVTESDEGTVDLVIEFGNVTLPRRIVSGGKGVARFPVTITNKGTVAIERRQRVKVQIVARPEGVSDASSDVVIATAENEPIGGMRPGEDRRLYLVGEFPGPLEMKSYSLRAVVDPDNTVSESDKLNNHAVLPDTIAVAAPNTDLLADISGLELPKGFVAGVAREIVIPVKVTNAGNLSFDPDQKVDIKVFARPAEKAMDDAADIVIGEVRNWSIYDLTTGRSEIAEVKATIAANMPVGSYILRAVVDPDNVVKEANKGNNTAMLLDPLNLMALVVDLAAEFVDTKAPSRIIAGTTPRIIAPVRLTNSGSVPFEKGQKIDVKLVLRPEDATDAKKDIVLVNAGGRSIDALTPKQSMVVDLDVAAPADLPVGHYVLMAIADAGDAIKEADETNNAPRHATPVVVEAPFIDLAAGVVTLRPARAIVAGSDQRLAVPVKVTNAGNIPVPAGQKIDITIAARHAGKLDDATHDVALEKLEGQSISGLAPGASEMFQGRVQFPSGMTAGDYVLVAHVDSGVAIKEAEKANNIAMTPAEQSIKVAAPVVDLAADVVNLRLPESVIAGHGEAVTIPVKVINQGNVPLAADAKIDIRISARPAGADASKDTALTTLAGQSVGGVVAGESKIIDVPTRIPGSVQAGGYVFVVLIDSAQAIAEADEANNTTVTPAGQAINVVAPFIDLVVDLVNPSLPQSVIAGHGPSASVPVKVTNAGNVAVDADQKIDIRFLARPAAATDDKQDAVVATLEGRSIAGLAPGKSVEFAGTVTLPTGLKQGSYAIVAVVDPSNVIKDANRANNVAVTSSAKAIKVASPFVDLAAAISAEAAPKAAIAGASPRFTLPVSITNVGNIAVPADQKIGIRVVARPATAKDDKQDVPVATMDDVSIGALAASESRTFGASVRLPETLQGGEYILVATIDSAGVVAESDKANNVVMMSAASAIKVAAPFVDLVASVNVEAAPKSAIAGAAAAFAVPVRVTNAGNVAVLADQKIGIRVAARPTSAQDGKQDVTLAVIDDAAIGALGASESRQFITSVRLPAALKGGDYVLVATVDTAGAVAESDKSNNVALMPAASAIKVAEPFVDLVATMIVDEAPKAAISGATSRFNVPIRVTNAGNVAVPGDQKIGIRVAARPASAKDDKQDVAVAVIDDAVVAALGAGEAKQFNASVHLPETLKGGDYMLVATVDTAGAVTESEKSNNVALMPAASAIKVAEPFVDLVTTLDVEAVPKSAIAGVGPRFALTARTTNAGNVPVPGDRKVAVRFMARPIGAADDSKDVALVSLDDQQIGGLGVGAGKQFSAMVTMPATLAAGDYRLVAVVDPAAVVADANRANNVAVSADASPVKVVLPYVNLVAAIDVPDGIGTVISSVGPRFTATVKVTNAGNVPLADDSKIDIRFHARPASATDASQDAEVAALTERSVGGLKPDASTSFASSILVPAGLKPGDYVIVASVDTGNVVTESSKADNIAASSTANPVKVIAPVHDVAVEIVNAVLPASYVGGSGVAISLPVRVTNAGNVQTDSDRKIDVSFFARPADSAGDGSDVALMTLEGQPFAGVAPGDSRSWSPALRIPEAMAGGRFILGARIASADAVPANNVATTARDVAIGVVKPVVDLAVQLESSDALSDVILGTRVISTRVVIANRGNIVIPDDATVNIRLVARPPSFGRDDAQDVPLAEMKDARVAGIAPEGNRTFTQNVTVSADRMPTDDYVIVGFIEPAAGVKDADEFNNVAVLSDKVVSVGERFKIGGKPVPFDSDGPQRYAVTGLELSLPQGLPNAPTIEQIMQLNVELSETYAGWVARRSGEATQKLRLGDVAQFKGNLYRSAVREICNAITDHLEHVGIRNVVVRPDPTQIDRKGDDLRPSGQTVLKLVVTAR